MIFITLGGTYFPFDRLLAPFADWGGAEELVVQFGTSSIRPASARCVDFMPFDALVDEVRRARLVVTHAGIGSVLVALSHGKKPIVVPRLRRFGEAVDDHQLGSARRLEEAGLVTLVEEPADVPSFVRGAAAAEITPPRPGRLVHELHALIEETLAPRNGSPLPTGRARRLLVSRARTSGGA